MGYGTHVSLVRQLQDLAIILVAFCSGAETSFGIVVMTADSAIEKLTV